MIFTAGAVRCIGRCQGRDWEDLRGRICLDVGSDDGQSPWSILPSNVLLECRDGHAHTQERPGSLGAGACASGWPWYCLPVLL